MNSSTITSFVNDEWKADVKLTHCVTFHKEFKDGDEDKAKEQSKAMIDLLRLFNPEIDTVDICTHTEGDCNDDNFIWVNVYYTISSWFFDALSLHTILKFSGDKNTYWLTRPIGKDSAIELLQSKRVMVVNDSTKEVSWKDSKDIISINMEGQK